MSGWCIVFPNIWQLHLNILYVYILRRHIMVHLHVTFLKLNYKHTIFIFPFLPPTLSVYLLTMCSFKLMIFDLFSFVLQFTHTHISKYINKIWSIFIKLHTWILSQDWQLGWYWIINWEVLFWGGFLLVLTIFPSSLP